MVTKVLERFAEQSSIECEFSPKFDKFFKKIKNQKFLDKIEQGMKEICENPYIGERKKGPLKNVYGHKIYHVSTPYVISYKIFKIQNETQKGIEFFMIEGRGGDYRRIERYAKTSKHN